MSLDTKVPQSALLLLLPDEHTPYHLVLLLHPNKLVLENNLTERYTSCKVDDQCNQLDMRVTDQAEFQLRPHG
jgi:hypothetical protein